MHKHRIIGVILLLLALGIGLYFYQIGLKGLGVGNFSWGNYLISPLSRPQPITATSGKPTAVQPASETPVYSAPQPTSTQPQIDTSSIPVGFTRNDLSPYFQKVNIASAQAPFFGYYGQISIQAYNLAAGEKVDVTGWTIKWNKAQVIIPQGVQFYDPSGWEFPADINLTNNSVVNMYSGQNPLGVNLELNKCVGYLANYYQFAPELPSNCPATSNSEISNLSGDCQNYILSINGSCREPDPNLAFTFNDPSCSAALNNFNYHSCFVAHRADADFLSNEWRVWNIPLSFDQSHDRLLLLDDKGMLVSQYQY